MNWIRDHKEPLPVITDALRERLFATPRPRYATIIPTRSTKPAVATHTTLGQAKNAVKASSMRGPYSAERGGMPCAEAEVYEWSDRDDEWRLKWRIEHGTYPNDLPWARITTTDELVDN